MDTRVFPNQQIAEFVPVWERAISSGNIQQIETLRPRYLEVFGTEWLSEDLGEALKFNREDVADYFIQQAELKNKHGEVIKALDAILYDAACSFNNLREVKYALSRGASRDPGKIREYIGMARYAGFHDVVAELERAL